MSIRSKSKPKMKTRKTAASRFSLTGTGKKVRFRAQGMRHILTKKSSKRKRHLRRMTILPLTSGLVKKVKKLIPYA